MPTEPKMGPKIQINTAMASTTSRPARTPRLRIQMGVNQLATQSAAIDPKRHTLRNMTTERPSVAEMTWRL